MKLLFRAVVMSMLVLAVAACQKVVYRDREPEPTPPPPPGIEGTWEFVDSFQEDGTTIHDHVLVTFTKERYIEAFESRDSDGMLIDRWVLRGTWQVSDGTITKTYDEYGHDMRLMGSVKKAYYWGDDAHDTLWVQEWRSREPRPDFSRLTRVKRALPTTAEAITGKWRFLHHSGTEWKMTITAEGDFELAWARDYPENPNLLSGQVVSIDIENLYVYLSGLTRYHAGDDETRVFLSQLSDAADGTGRIAFAPAQGGNIRVSNPWNEPPNLAILREADEWEDQPYGNYWMLFSKEQ